MNTEFKNKKVADLTVKEFQELVTSIEPKPTCDISLKTWLSEKELMMYVSLCRDKIRAARESGRLPFLNLMGKITYQRSEVDKWVKHESRYRRINSKRLDK